MLAFPFLLTTVTFFFLRWGWEQPLFLVCSVNIQFLLRGVCSCAYVMSPTHFVRCFHSILQETWSKQVTNHAVLSAYYLPITVLGIYILIMYFSFYRGTHTVENAFFTQYVDEEILGR